jgi:putative membrane protein
MRIPTFSAAVLLGSALAFAASAQTASPNASPSRSTPAQSQSQKPKEMSASTFVRTAARGDMFEIQAGKVALGKAKSDSVKNFAQMIIDDHTAASQKLQQVVKDEKIKVTIPKDLDKKHKDMLGKLNKASASSFDRTYMQSQIAAHREAVATFQSYSRNGSDAGLKQFAVETLPVLQKHLSQAEQISPERGGGQVQRTPDRSNPGTTQGGSSGAMPEPGAGRPASGGR